MKAQPTKDQLLICQRFSSEILTPSSSEKLGIALNTLHHLPLTAVRHLAINDTCGWYIWGGEYSTNPEFFQALHVAHISEYCPQIQPYLALAPGWGVVLAPGHEDVWFDRALLET